MNTDTLCDLLNDTLHGSGFDGEWTVTTRKNGDFVATIGYHAMSELGYYDGWFNVVVTIAPDITVKRVNFTASRYHRRYYIENDGGYFGDTIHDAVSQIRRNFTESEEE